MFTLRKYYFTVGGNILKKAIKIMGVLRVIFYFRLLIYLNLLPALKRFQAQIKEIFQICNAVT